MSSASIQMTESLALIPSAVESQFNRNAAFRERLYRERSFVFRSQTDRRGATQWNHRRRRGRQPCWRSQPLSEGNQDGELVTREQAKDLLTVPDRSKIKGKRDYAILALLLGCALRRQELASLDVDGIEMREGRWVLPDLCGKGGRVRTVAIPL
jgi:integrase